MVFGVMSKFMQFQIYFKPKFPVLLHIKEFCKVKISIFTRNTILWPHFPDSWDDAHAQIQLNDVLALTLFTALPTRFFVENKCIYIYREKGSWDSASGAGNPGARENITKR